MVAGAGLAGRGSIAWEKPVARSTMVPPPMAIEESTFDCSSTFLDETLSGDQRYDGLLKLIDDLKDQLIKEKQDKIQLESDIRTELCTEFDRMMVEIEESWEKRYIYLQLFTQFYD